MARIAAASGNPTQAFEYATHLQTSGAPARLRSYTPALLAFAAAGQVCCDCLCCVYVCCVFVCCVCGVLVVCISICFRVCVFPMWVRDFFGGGSVCGVKVCCAAVQAHDTQTT